MVRDLSPVRQSWTPANPEDSPGGAAAGLRPGAAYNAGMPNFDEQIREIHQLLQARPQDLPALRVRIDALGRGVEQQEAAMRLLRQDVEDAEHARDAANLARMKIQGQLNVLQKSLAAALPEVGEDTDPQSAALERIEWLAVHGKPDPEAAAAAKEAEMNAPVPSRAVLEAVLAGERAFTKEQLEFTIAEVMVLTGWQMTPLELTGKGQVWLAEQVFRNQFGE